MSAEISFKSFGAWCYLCTEEIASLSIPPTKEESQKPQRGIRFLFCFSIDKPEEDMSFIGPVLIGILFMQIPHWHHQLIIFVNGDIAVNCGSVDKFSAVDGREWIEESASECMSGKSRNSAADQTSFRGVDPVPYKTSRISATEFGYTFRLNPGQKFIRLHFYPASYRGFEKSVDYFSVKAGAFTLLRDYSASLAAETLGVKYIVKEFCLNVEKTEQLNIMFSPSSSGKTTNKVHAFVNGIEIISMPTGLYYTSEHDIGARIVGLSNRFYSIDNSTALELVQRFNIGGSSMTSVEDFGLFRQWDEDTNYLMEPKAHRVNHLVLKIKYTNIPAFLAPQKIYHTSWKSRIRIGVNQIYNFSWKVPVDLGFGYLVRLHFCELDYRMAEREPREFSVLINSQVAETKADVIRWSGDIGIPVYRDYVVIMDGDREGSESDLLIGLQSTDELVFGLLKGLEILKLSNIENNLASASLVFPKRVSTTWNQKIENWLLAFGQSNVMGTAMTVLIILLGVVTYNISKIWGENFQDGKDARSASVEPSNYCFSLAEIKLATQNFSDAFVIGRGGFGKVYKGFIHGVPEAVAIKRLDYFSRQGPREFWTEIETLSKLRHIHLVSLIGYCNEHQEMILVYEYIPGGTLADNLYKFARKGKDCSRLSWEQRLRICIDAARGLEYLHTGGKYGVIHRDVKDTNILLDENLVAKISDFGLCKPEKITKSKSHVSTKVKGTVGFLDPDYFLTNRLTRKSDVYSFGVVLLVVLSGRPVVDNKIPEEPQSLLSCFRECMAEGDFSRIIDPCLQDDISSIKIREFVKIVETCLQQAPKRRPTMTQVVAGLEQALEGHEGPSFASADATVVGQSGEEGNMKPFQLLFDAPVPEEIVIAPPKEGDTSISTQNLSSPTGSKDMQLSGKDINPAPKPLWGLPWKALWRRAGNKQNAEEPVPEDMRLYEYEALAIATHNFHSVNIIHYGYSGAVYKGILSNGQEIAVKLFSDSDYRRNMEFRNEAEVMSKLQHRNVVCLLGCCVERSQRILVYEHLPNGDLAHLFDSGKRDLLDWNRRKIIIEGIARGLLYLHQDSRVKVIHRNLSMRNILLDKVLNPKIAGFCCARITMGSVEQTSVIRVTNGYMAPEYARYGLCSEKTDVYSYGVMLLEIISGKRISTAWFLEIELAWKLWNENETMKLVDPAILFPGIETEILRYVHVGLLCVQDSANDRPDVSTILSMLKNEISELPHPKSPAYFEGGDSLGGADWIVNADSVNDMSSIHSLWDRDPTQNRFWR